MKKSTLFLAAAAVAILFSSCNTTGQFAKFTSSDRLYQVQPGNSYETVVSTLGCEPYNLLCKQADGYDIYVYKYKIVERWFSTKDINQRGAETGGDEVYRAKEESAYLVFKDNKLEFLVTGEGRKDAAKLVLLNNTIYEVSKNSKGEYVILPSTTDAAKEEGGAIFKKK
ncbi:MAG: hypothetical protein J5644_03105 [Bacteroidales bacterium]|nr:hypothetical protein [Bacteroidales bacterium]